MVKLGEDRTYAPDRQTDRQTHIHTASLWVLTTTCWGLQSKLVATFRTMVKVRVSNDGNAVGLTSVLDR